MTDRGNRPHISFPEAVARYHPGGEYPDPAATLMIAATIDIVPFFTSVIAAGIAPAIATVQIIVSIIVMWVVSAVLALR